jgi:transposase InsO family protein
VIWDWQARNSPPLRSLQPVRETRASWHARHIPVSAFSMSNDDHVWLESGLEHDLLRKCDRDPRARWLVSQPFQLSWGGPTPGRHTPDLLSLSAEDEVTVWDARRLDEQDETFGVQAEVTRQCCETVGWHYEVFNGLATIERLNLLWLDGFRRRPDWLPRQIDLIRRVAGGKGISLRDLFTFDDGSGELKSVDGNLFGVARSASTSCRRWMTILLSLWMRSCGMSDGRTALTEGTRVLTGRGTGVAVSIGASGWTIRDAFGGLEVIGYLDVTTVREVRVGEVAPMADALRPLWDAIDENARTTALDRLEVVQEIFTGYREGHRELAREGEPRYPFGPGFGVSETRRCEVMAGILTEERVRDRAVQRRVQDGEIRAITTNPSTIRKWLRAWKDGGLRALIDGRSLRARKSWDLIDLRYREAAVQEVDALDGDKSTVADAEIHRRALVQLKDDGARDLVIPQRLSGEFISQLRKQRGATPRAQRSNRLRETSGTQHFPAIRPGQVVAIDATRADNLVFSPLSGKPYSVEILTAIDVSTRVVVALRVTPRSADGIDAGLMVYDICRPFSAIVRGTTMTDWRWVGLPEHLDLSHIPVRIGRQLFAPDFSTLRGAHHIPSVRPDAIHADQGAIFVCRLFRALLRALGIDLLLSRGGHPTDNPHVERWHETLQRALQQYPGYKGRNTSERGRLVSKEPLMTAQELQDHLRRFVALDWRVPVIGSTPI